MKISMSKEVSLLAKATTIFSTTWSENVETTKPPVDQVAYSSTIRQLVKVLAKVCIVDGRIVCNLVWSWDEVTGGKVSYGRSLESSRE